MSTFVLDSWRHGMEHKVEVDAFEIGGSSTASPLDRISRYCKLNLKS